MADFLDHEPASTPKHTVCSINFRLAVAHEEMNSRRRNTMEDCHRILSTLHPELPLHSYLGIYDGHGGRQIVDFLEDALENNIAKELLLEDDASIAERITRYVVNMFCWVMIFLIV